MEKAKERIAAKDAAVQPAFDALLAEADKALKLAPPSVMDKPKTPDSGDQHDYLSQAPYFWPDPTKPDGRPYLRKDGQRNPEAGDESSDAPRMGRMGHTAETLALAYYFTGKDAYAEHAAMPRDVSRGAGGSRKGWQARQTAGAAGPRGRACRVRGWRWRS